MRKEFWLVFSLGVAMLACARPGYSQQLSLAELKEHMQSEPWAVTVEGEQRARVLVVQSVSEEKDGVFRFTGTYNFADGKPTPLTDGQLTLKAGTMTMVLTPASGSVVTANSNADGSFSGIIKYTNGKEKPIRLEKGAELASAAPPSKMLGKADAGALVSGKTLVIRRVSDGAEIVWELRKDGVLFGQNRSTFSTDTGSWEINDRGAVCTKWMKSAAGCSMLQRDGDKYTMHSSPKAPVRYQVISIK